MNFIKKSLKRSLLPFLKGYFRLRMIWPVWAYGINFRPRMRWDKEGAVFSAVERRIIQDLTAYGIAIAYCDELFPGENIFEELKKFTETLREEKQSSNIDREKLSKPFLTNLFESSPSIHFDNPFHCFAVSPKIVNIINGYFEMYAKLYYLTLNITTPVEARKEAVASQRWHRDPEDRKMCKVFLYLNDVDESAGPFIYITKSRYGLKYGSLFPQKPPIGVYPDAAILEKSIAKEDIKICTGRAGTIIFCDTSGFHKGGYATQNERIMFTAGYRTNGAVTPNRIRYPEGYRQKLDAMKFLNPAYYAAFPHEVSRRNRKLFSYVMRWQEEVYGKDTYHEG